MKTIRNWDTVTLEISAVKIKQLETDILFICFLYMIYRQRISSDKRSTGIAILRKGDMAIFLLLAPEIETVVHKDKSEKVKMGLEIRKY